MSRKRHQAKHTSVRDFNPDLLEVIKIEMAKEDPAGVSSKSDGAAVKWAATQFAIGLQKKSTRELEAAVAG